MPRRRTAPLTALLLSFALALGACGGEEHPEDHATEDSATEDSAAEDSAAEDSAAEDSTGSASSPDEGDGGTTIRLERADDAFTPSGERVEVPAGEPITLEIEADEAGELHVHSTPEQEIAYDAGSSTHEVTIERPGVVEVESHEPHLVVLQLEAR